MATLRSLEELARDEVEVNRLFAYDFAGDLQPKPFPPHEADWNEADRHWVEFTTRVLGSGALDRRWGRKRSGPAAERYAQFLL